MRWAWRSGSSRRQGRSEPRRRFSGGVPETSVWIRKGEKGWEWGRWRPLAGERLPEGELVFVASEKVAQEITAERNRALGLV